MRNKHNKILLTGSTGQVGWELQKSLSTLVDIIAPNRNEFNLLKPESLRAKIQEWKPDLIINTAAYTAVDQAENESELAFIINATAPRVMAEEAVKLHIPLVHYSTDYVFDGKKKTPYTEEDKPNPLNVYGESKLEGEEAIKETLEHHLILRTSWVYSHRGTNFLTKMIKLLQENDEIIVVDDQIGTPTYAGMLANITTVLIKDYLQFNANIPLGLYHITASGSTTWYGFTKIILDELNLEEIKIIKPISSKQYTTKAKRPLMTSLNNTKLNSELGETQQDWKKELIRVMKNI
jgi:dTDP-4-dehydrorhamnose reductase